MLDFMKPQSSWEAYTGDKLSKNLRRLSRIKALEDIPPISNSIFPGTHCPLMGALLVAKGIEDCCMLVAGTDECAYYNKEQSLSGGFGGLKGRVYSLVLDSHDVTFGSLKKLYKAMDKLCKTIKPKAIMLTTTCLIEIIGDDYDSAAEELEKKYGVPILVVHTEHFKCDDHFPGVEKGLASCIKFMAKLPAENKVNILGQRFGSFSATELGKLLKEQGIGFGLELPGKANIEELKQAGAARFNIVVGNTGLLLAKAMEKKLGIPYVYFNSLADPEEVLQQYIRLFELLEQPVPANLMAKYQICKALEKQAKSMVQGRTYVYANSFFDHFALNAYLCRMGMVPLSIQTNHYNAEDMEQAEGIRPYADPYICRAANMAPRSALYKLLKPEMLLGGYFGEKDNSLNVAVVGGISMSSAMGMEACELLLKNLLEAGKEVQGLRGEAEHL